MHTHTRECARSAPLAPLVVVHGAGSFGHPQARAMLDELKERGYTSVARRHVCARVHARARACVCVCVCVYVRMRFYMCVCVCVFV